MLYLQHLKEYLKNRKEKGENVFISQAHEHAAKNIAGSRLKIINLDVSDVGFYTCRVTNGKDQIQSEGTLRVDSSKNRHGKLCLKIIYKL